ncbi:unnamed protein product, partial [Prorocentrum cordatum]
MEDQLYGKRKASEKFNQYVTEETSGIFRRPGAALVFDGHQDDIYSSGSDPELKWLKENLAPVVKLKEASIMMGGSVHPFLRATPARVSNAVIYIAPRPKRIEDTLSELGLADCSQVPTPMVSARKTEDLDMPVVGPVDKKSCITCVGILRHLLKSRPDIPFALHE